MNNASKNNYTQKILENYSIPKSLYKEYDVKRGLRNADGTGVLAGLTKISSVVGFKKDGDKIVPVDGELYYRGIHINDLVKKFEAEKRHGFEDVIFLLLIGSLPTNQELNDLRKELRTQVHLPNSFVEDVFLQIPSNNVMNMLQRAVLALYSLDENADDISIENVLKQSISLIAKFPAIIAYSFNAIRFKFGQSPLFLRTPRSDMDTAENFLYMLRESGKFTKLEADLLDLALILHAEHGGGNNSAFTIHVLTSSHTDTYSAVSGALASLKGPLHGAANSYVRGMIEDIQQNVKDWSDEKELASYLVKILKGEAYDKKGLIYGMGHAVYTKSDPRALILKKKAKELAAEKNRLDEYYLYESIERLAPSLFQEVKKNNKIISPNVDFYSGFVYDMLGFPREIYPSLFAMARIVGWCAHRMEELINGKRIIRPAYKGV